MTRTRVAAPLVAAACVLAAITASVGLFVVGFYRDAPSWAAQARGADLATLLLALPVAAAAWWVGRRRPAVGQSVTGGVLLYLLYTYVLCAFSVAWNPVTVAYIAIAGCVVWSLLLAAPARLADDAAVPVLRRATGAYLTVVAGLFALLWLSQIAAALATGRPPADVTDAGLPTNPVYVLDLAFFLPLAAAAGGALLRRLPIGERLALPVLVWTALMSAQIVGGFLFLAASGAAVPVPVAIVIAALGVVAAALAAAPLVRDAEAVPTRPGARPIEAF